jgi:hypothetical protein
MIFPEVGMVKGCIKEIGMNYCCYYNCKSNELTVSAVLLWGPNFYLLRILIFEHNSSNKYKIPKLLVLKKYLILNVFKTT